MGDVLATSFAPLSAEERALLLGLLQQVVGEDGAHNEIAAVRKQRRFDSA
jgi:hypothetical protein